MNFEIAIPSYKRALILNSQTLATLNKCGIPKDRINIFVVEDELNEYNTKLNPDYYNKIIVGMKGLIQQRKFIENYYPEGTNIVSFDDDIKEIDLSLTNYPNVVSFIEDAFKKCKEHNAYIWGVYPVHNPFFRQSKEDLTTELKFIIGTWYGFINRPKLIDLNTTDNNIMKEDVERSIKYFLNDGIVLRFNKVGFKTKCYGNDGGGLGTFKDRLAPSKENAEKLVEKYPDICSLKERKNGMAEVVLSAVKSFKPHKPQHLTDLDISYNQVFQELEKIKFINMSLKSGRERGLGVKYGKVFGMVQARISRKFGLSAESKKYPETYEMLKKIGDKITEKYGLQWNGIQINKNATCKAHKDKNNTGLSVIFSVGDFSGGELVIGDKPYDTHNNPLLFDGKNYVHYNNEFKAGTKYSITYFMGLKKN